MCKKIWLILVATHSPGLATVKYLLSRGQQVVVLMDWQPDTEMIEKNNPDLELLIVDFSSKASTQKATQTILHKYKCIDMLINMYAPCKNEDHNNVRSDEKAVLFMIRSMLCLLRRSSYNHLIDYTSGIPEHAVDPSLDMLYRQAEQAGTKVTIV